MPLNTNFDVTPYYDDYSEDKNFYRILFKPATAVQARELTQLQTIIQTQIERFGDSIYKSGSIIDGCGVVTIPRFDYVALNNRDNNTINLVTPSSLVNTIAESANTGLKALVLSSIAANSTLSYPDSANKIYVRYLNSGNSAGNEIKLFQDSDTLNFYSTAESYYTTTANTTTATNSIKVTSNSGISNGLFTVASGVAGNVYVTNVIGDVVTVSSVVSIANNTNILFFDKSPVNDVNTGFYSVSTQSSSATGFGYGIICQPGIIYQKGFFIKVNEHTIVVSNTSTNPGNTVVGFTTEETIISSNQDESLLDNALGYSNENAPGADRLKLTSILTPLDPEIAANTAGFAPIVQFYNGVPSIKNTDSQYSRLGDELARRSNETSGNYVINPFTLDTTAHASNSNLLIAQVSPGIGYVQGYRVELIGTTGIGVRRGIDVANSSNQIITTTYGNYVYVNEVSGPFNFDEIQSVDIYDAATQAITNYVDRTSGSPSGSKIGTANFRTVSFVDGIRGAPTGRYAFYLFNIKITTSGKSFSENAKSFYSATTPRAFADIILDSNNRAVIRNAEQRNLVYSFGKKAIRAVKNQSNVVDAQFIARTSANTTLYANGIISLTVPTPHGGGTDQYPYSTGVLSDVNDAKFIITLLSTANTANLAGNVSISSSIANVTGNGTSFDTQFASGKYIGTTDGSNFYYKRIVSVTNSTFLTVDSAWSVTNTAINYFVTYPAGHTVPMDTATVNITSSTVAVIDTGLVVSSNNLLNSISIKADFDILRISAAPAIKTINKNRYVKIDTATHSANNVGPWSLGVPDIHKINNVWVGSSYANTNTDMLSSFYFDTGQRDTHHDLGMLYLRPGTSITASQKILVSFDAFTSNTVSGVGYYSKDSYTIDDANTANTTAITTSNIPLYVSDTSRTYALRDSIDFRPYVSNTGNLASSIATATENPSANTTGFIVDGSAYTPSPDENFQSSIQYYLGRKDIIYFDTIGNLKTKEGSASETPINPVLPEDGMAIAVLDVKPYPSLVATQKQDLINTNITSKRIIRDITYGNQNSIITNRRYTMKDIGSIENRVSRLEYYAALNLLEKSAIDLQISDSNGLNRFKNGIFAEPFTSHVLGEVSNPEYKIAIDPAISQARPYFTENNIKLEYSPSDSSGVEQTSRLITLPYNSAIFISQSKASKYIAASVVPFNWAGNITLYPNYSDTVDKNNAAAVQSNIDLAQSWSDFSNSPWGSNYGLWRTMDTNVQQNVVNTGEYTYTSTIEASNQNRDISKIDIKLVNNQYNLGNIITDVSILPYISSVEIAFRATNLRPNTKIYAFFDDSDVNSLCAPGDIDASITDTSNHNIIIRNSPWGTQLVTDSSGNLYGKFIIPNGRFRTGQKRLRLIDSSDINTDASNITTSASATFNASNISIKSANYTLTTTTPEIATNSTEEVQTVTTAQTQTNVTYNPKPAENPNYGYINDNRVDIGEGPNANGGGFGGDNGNSDTPGGGGGTAGEG